MKTTGIHKRLISYTLCGLLGVASILAIQQSSPIVKNKSELNNHTKSETTNKGDITMELPKELKQKCNELIQSLVTDTQSKIVQIDVSDDLKNMKVKVQGQNFFTEDNVDFEKVKGYAKLYQTITKEQQEDKKISITYYDNQTGKKIHTEQV